MATSSAFTACGHSSLSLSLPLSFSLALYHSLHCFSYCRSFVHLFLGYLILVTFFCCHLSVGHVCRVAIAGCMLQVAGCTCRASLHALECATNSLSGSYRLSWPGAGASLVHYVVVSGQFRLLQAVPSKHTLPHTRTTARLSIGSGPGRGPGRPRRRGFRFQLQQLK